MLDGQRHTTGSAAVRGNQSAEMHACTTRLDTGSPASIIQEMVWSRMFVCGAVFHDGLTNVKPETWGGLHGIHLPLNASDSIYR